MLCAPLHNTTTPSCHVSRIVIAPHDHPSRHVSSHHLATWQALLVVDPTDRLTAPAACDHAWIASGQRESRVLSAGYSI